MIEWNDISDDISDFNMVVSVATMYSLVQQSSTECRKTKPK